MTDTKHLDTAIGILKGTKRAPKANNLDVYVTIDGRYTMQFNGRIVEEGDGMKEYAVQRAEERRRSMERSLGKPVTVVVYD